MIVTGLNSAIDAGDAGDGRDAVGGVEVAVVAETANLSLEDF